MKTRPDNPTPPANDVCPECNGKGYYRFPECEVTCNACHGTGKAPSIASKVPLASVDAAPVDPKASGYVPPVPEGWYRLSNGTPLQHGDCFAWEDAWQDVEPSGLAHSGGEFIRKASPSAPSAGAGTPDNQYQRILKRLIAGESYSDATQSKIEPAAPDAGPTPRKDEPVHRFALASWVSIYGRHCCQDFVQESDYAKLETELAAARAELDRIKQNIGCARNQRSTQFCAEAVAQAAELRAKDATIAALRAALDYALTAQQTLANLNDDETMDEIIHDCANVLGNALAASAP